MDRITERIYLGDINGVSNLYQLRKNKITHILTMAAGIRPLYKKEFKYKVVNIMDLPTQNILAHLDRAVEFINKVVTGGGRVLVHCHAGISRSATTVIAYFMATRKMTFIEGFKYVKQRRPIIFPNFGFQRQLGEYENILQERFKAKKNHNIENIIENHKKSIESVQNNPSSYTPYTRHNKLKMSRKNERLSMSPKTNKQLKPTQFHYP